MIRYDVLILFAAIGLMVVTICGVGWEDIQSWFSFQWQKFFKERKAKK